MVKAKKVTGYVIEDSVDTEQLFESEQEARDSIYVQEVERYECGECGEKYEDKEEAKECCK